jgi:hypothetical protein
VGEAIAQILDTRAAAGPRTAALTDLLNRARPIVDHGSEVTIRGWVADADQHGSDIDNAFQIQFRQGLIARPASGPKFWAITGPWETLEGDALARACDPADGDRRGASDPESQSAPTEATRSTTAHEAPGGRSTQGAHKAP